MHQLCMAVVGLLRPFLEFFSQFLYQYVAIFGRHSLLWLNNGRHVGAIREHAWCSLTYVIGLLHRSGFSGSRTLYNLTIFSWLTGAIFVLSDGLLNLHIDGRFRVNIHPLVVHAMGLHLLNHILFVLPYVLSVVLMTYLI